MGRFQKSCWVHSQGSRRVRLLLDTHVLLWWLSDDRNLAKNARDIIANPDNEVIVSSASAWEISIKAALGRLEISWMTWKMQSSEMVFGRCRSGYNTLTAGRLPNVHRDPLDRMLVAQTSAEALRVVSHDRVFERYRLAAEGLPPIIV
jgi:PIN domain nuclease of toxin-antitoxin system